MKYLVLLLLFIPLYTYSQCPFSITGDTNGSKDCIRISWNSGETPSPLPGTVSWNGQNYTLESNQGSNPADYRRIGSNCNGVLPGIALTGTLSFESESCNYTGGTLPVDFTDFFLVPDDGVIIKWVTASELNNDFFSIERSRDGKSWNMIGVVDGSGTSNTLNDYTFRDPRPHKGISYYRIKQVDFNGTYRYSETLTHNNLQSYSNVFIRAESRQLIIENEDNFENYLIQNLNGQLISRGTLNEGTNILSFYESHQGMLIVTLSGYTTQSFKVIMN